MAYQHTHKTWVAAAAAALLFIPAAFAHSPKHKVFVPESMPHVMTVSAEEVVSLAEKKSDLVIIDSRVTADRKQIFIEGSVGLPDEQTNCKSLESHIPKKTAPVLFYCNGVKCGRSVVAIKIAQKCGYRNIYWFRGGMEEWLAKRLPTAHY